MKELRGAVIEELKLLLEIWKALDDPKLREPPHDAKAIGDGRLRVGRWIEHHLKQLPSP